MISLTRASLRYGQVLGLSPITFNLPKEGGITGLLGPNGAGKSSLIQLLSGLLPPSSGEIRIFGESPFRNPHVLARIGLVPEGDRFPAGMRAHRWLRMMAELSGLPPENIPSTITKTLKTVGMEDRAHLYFHQMSKGMRQRIRLAQALLHQPSLLILDEPFNGLDPEARLALMALLRKRAEEGVRILVSSHILKEVAQLTDHILLMFRGRLLAEGSVTEIRALLDQHPVELRILSDQSQTVARWAVEQPELAAMALEAEGIKLSIRQPRDFFPRLQKAVASGELPIQALDPLDLNLEAVFQYLTQDHA